jgi:hypothetical protein
MKCSTALGDSCHIHSSSPLPLSDQVHGLGYTKSEVETDKAAIQLETSTVTLELETDATALELKTDAAGLELEMNARTLELDKTLYLEMEIDVPQGLSKQERYLAD